MVGGAPGATSRGDLVVNRLSSPGEMNPNNTVGGLDKRPRPLNDEAGALAGRNGGQGEKEGDGNREMESWMEALVMEDDLTKPRSSCSAAISMLTSVQEPSFLGYRACICSRSQD